MIYILVGLYNESPVLRGVNECLGDLNMCQKIDIFKKILISAVLSEILTPGLCLAAAPRSSW